MGALPKAILPQTIRSFFAQGSDFLLEDYATCKH